MNVRNLITFFSHIYSNLAINGYTWNNDTLLTVQVTELIREFLIYCNANFVQVRPLLGDYETDVITELLNY